MLCLFGKFWQLSGSGLVCSVISPVIMHTNVCKSGILRRDNFLSIEIYGMLIISLFRIRVRATLWKLLSGQVYFVRVRVAKSSEIDWVETGFIWL